MMHLHLIEPRADGHRMQYVRRLVEATPKHWSISLSTFSGSVEHPATQQALAAASGRITLVTMRGQSEFERRYRGADGFRLQPAYWRMMQRHWQALRPTQRGDLAVVPYLDYCSYAIGLMGSPFGETPFSGIVMRPDFQWLEQGVIAPAPTQPRLKQWLFQRLLAHPRLRCLLTIDPSLRDWTARHRPVGHYRLRFAPDPSDLKGVGDRTEARRHFGLRPDATVVLLYGSIDLRKGVSQLLDATTGSGCPDDTQVLLAGSQSVEVREYFVANLGRLVPGRHVMVDRYLSRQDEWLAFTAADACWVAYDAFFGPSGVVAQCVQAGVKMIYRPQGLIGYQLSRVSQSAELPWVRAFGLSVALATPNASVESGEPGLEQVFGP